MQVTAHLIPSIPLQKTNNKAPTFTKRKGNTMNMMEALRKQGQFQFYDNTGKKDKLQLYPLLDCSTFPNLVAAYQLLTHGNKTEVGKEQKNCSLA